MRGLKRQGATVDDAVEATRAAAARGRPLDGPAGLQVAPAVEADDVRAEHVTVERDAADLVVVPDGPSGLHDPVLPDYPVAGDQGFGGKTDDRSRRTEELDGRQLALETEPTGRVRLGLRGGDSARDG